MEPQRVPEHLGQWGEGHFQRRRALPRHGEGDDLAEGRVEQVEVKGALAFDEDDGGIEGEVSHSEGPARVAAVEDQANLGQGGAVAAKEIAGGRKVAAVQLRREGDLSVAFPVERRLAGEEPREAEAVAGAGRRPRSEPTRGFRSGPGP